MLLKNYFILFLALVCLFLPGGKPESFWLTPPSFSLLAPADATRAQEPLTLKALQRHIQTRWRVPERTAQSILAAATKEAAAHNLPLSLLLAIMAKESSFKPDAKSAYGALGLMQVVPRWHPEKLDGLDKKDLYEPAINVRVGAKVLNEYLAQNDGDVRAALFKYSGAMPSYPAKVLRYKADFEEVIRNPEDYI